MRRRRPTPAEPGLPPIARALVGLLIGAVAGALAALLLPRERRLP